MSTRLSRSEREFIVGSYLKGKPVAGYDVIECANGKYRVKAKPFEVESSDEPEEEPIKQESVKQEPVQQESAPHSGSTLTSARGAQSNKSQSNQHSHQKNLLTNPNQLSSQSQNRE